MMMCDHRLIVTTDAGYEIFDCSLPGIRHAQHVDKEHGVSWVSRYPTFAAVESGKRVSKAGDVQWQRF